MMVNQFLSYEMLQGDLGDLLAGFDLSFTSAFWNLIRVASCGIEIFSALYKEKLLDCCSAFCQAFQR